jgi:hypothetical protein
MPLTNAEFDAMLADTSKRIVGDLAWSEDEDHSPTVEFRAEVRSDAGWPLFVRGSYNPLAGTLSYMVILKTVGRVYGLDLGKDHHNPACHQVGEKHKHHWREQYKDKEAYALCDITVPVNDPVGVWRQFCAEFKLDHQGALAPPPPLQKDFLI